MLNRVPASARRVAAGLVRIRGPSKNFHSAAFVQNVPRLDDLLRAPSYSPVAASGEERPSMKSDSRRCGLLAMKVGMIPVFDDVGTKTACTVLLVENCQVTQIKDLNDTENLQMLTLERDVQKHFNLLDLEKCCNMRMKSQKSASIRPKTDFPKFR